MTAQQRSQYVNDGYLVVRGLIGGSDLAELDRMVDSLLDGALKPETSYKGWRPADFYTFWEPEMQDRGDLPRRERVRLISNMYHHHPYFKEFGSHRSIYEVASSLYRTGVRMFSDTIFVKPAHHGIEAALHQDTAFWPKTGTERHELLARHRPCDRPQRLPSCCPGNPQSRPTAPGRSDPGAHPSRPPDRRQ